MKTKIELVEREVAEMDYKELIVVSVSLVLAALVIAYGAQLMSETTDDLARCGNVSNTLNPTGVQGEPMLRYNSSSNLCMNATDNSENAQAPNNAAFRSATNGTLTVSNLADKTATIATVIGISVVIGILVVYLYARFVGGGKFKTM